MITDPFDALFDRAVRDEFGNALVDVHHVVETLEHSLSPGLRIFQCRCKGWKMSASAKPMTTGLTLQLQFVAHLRRMNEEI